MNFNASDKTSPHHFTRQEVYRLYTELRFLHPDGVNFAALFRALMKHPNLSRVTRHMGNNFDQYMSQKATNEKLKQLRQDFNETLSLYDHESTDPVVIPNPCRVMEAFWISMISYEAMDFDLAFIRYTTSALADSVITFCAAIAEEYGDLLEADSKLFDGTFEFTARGRSDHGHRSGASIELPQMLWNAMLDREVAIRYTKQYILTLVMSEPDDSSNDMPPMTQLH